MSRARALGGAALLLGLTGLLTGCSSDGGEDADAAAASASAAAEAATSASAAAAPTPAPKPPATPKVGTCYRMSFDQAVAPTATARKRDCARPHTAETYRVGALATVADGHLLAVDSDRAQRQVAEACPGGLSAYVGGDESALRLSMIRPVWFTPSVEESDEGANWFRCDAVVVTGSSGLATVDVSLRGILDRDADRDRVAMCGTAAPDADAFSRVPCAAQHSWRAISVVGLTGESYPGEQAARSRGDGVCEDAAAARADDPLDFQWGYEWPTEAQWESGMTFGRCWAPE
ncbi:septum formation family protein [Nocardioides sp. YIM 152588]|uniref:septum formation family protein n=1 Tax=Nocardioides sp. YIM 152588 TaxID=3158259 RepID=UPI0032E3CEBE